MSVVYRAHHVALDRKVALKLLAPELAEDERFRERFLRESKLAASLDHPSIVPIYDAGEVDGQLYIAMRYVEGSDLKVLLREEGALEPKRALALLAQLADALDAAHARGLVHRDVKPSNALLDSAEHVYLADFGLTKSASDRSALTVTGQIVGTVDYVAPEQLEGSPVDGRTDVYSLGCLFFECLTGEVPFPRDSELAVLWAHVQEPPPKASERNPTLPEAIDAVVAKGLAKEPSERYATCAELVEAAREALGLREVLIVRDRRPLVLTALGALVAAGALAAGLVLTLGGGAGRPKPDLTVQRNTLVRIDPKTNKIASVTKVGNGPESVAVGGDTVWVYNWKDRTVSELDARTSALRRTIGIPGTSPLAQAQTIAADASGAWVLSSGKGLLTHLRRSVLSLKQEFHLPGDLLTVAVGHHAVWVGAKTATRGSAVLRIDPDNGSVVTTVRLGASDVQSLAVGEGALWVLNQDGTLIRIDPTSGRITKRTQLPTQGAQGYAIAIGGGAIWASFINGGANSPLLGIDPQTLDVTTTVPPPTDFVSGGNLVVSDGTVWWNGADAGIVSRVDARSGSVVSTIQLASPIDSQRVLPSLVFEPVGMATGVGGIWVTMSIPFSSTK